MGIQRQTSRTHAKEDLQAHRADRLDLKLDSIQDADDNKEHVRSLFVAVKGTGVRPRTGAYSTVLQQQLV